MRALCPSCGLHHEVVRILEDGFGENRKDVYQVAPLENCPRSWLSDKDVLDARAKFDVEPIQTDENDD
jgi:hypothetical protein